jgi:hypothetical protein
MSFISPFLPIHAFGLNLYAIFFVANHQFIKTACLAIMTYISILSLRCFGCRFCYHPSSGLLIQFQINACRICRSLVFWQSCMWPNKVMIVPITIYEFLGRFIVFKSTPSLDYRPYLIAVSLNGLACQDRSIRRRRAL